MGRVDNMPRKNVRKWYSSPFLWILLSIGTVFVVSRIAIASSGVGQPGSLNLEQFFLAFSLAVIALTAMIGVANPLVIGPLERLHKELHDKPGGGALVLSHVEPELFEQVRVWTRGEGIGPWPWAAAFVLWTDGLSIWRPIHGGARELVRLENSVVECRVTEVRGIFGAVVVVLEVSSQGRAVRLYPRDCTKGQRGRRLSRAEVEALVGSLQPIE